MILEYEGVFGEYFLIIEINVYWFLKRFMVDRLRCGWYYFSDV